MSFLKRFYLSSWVLTLSMLGGIGISGAADKLPLEITADQQLEWNQHDRTYIARGKAKAVQGEFSVTADTLTAQYAEEGKSAPNDGSAGNITKLTAAGNVVLRSSHDHATAATAQYDLVKDVIELNGARPKLYRGNDMLEADQVTVTLKNRDFDHADATGNVIITKGATQIDEHPTQPKPDQSGGAPLQRAVADHAHYDGGTEIVTLTGKVKLWQGESWVEGSEAVLNLREKTNILKAAAGDAKTSSAPGQVPGRVKGIFYSAQPSAQKSNAQNTLDKSTTNLHNSNPSVTPEKKKSK